jgi:putative DNA primase/helicase
VIRPFAKEDYLTKRIDVDYTPSDCPTWKRFLDTIFLGNAETIHFMHKAIGYSLSASIEEQCIFILYGIGSNGKSTFLETIRDIVGEYAAAAGASTIMEKRGDNSIPNDIARLRGARFVTVNESDECKRLSESIVKSITGGDLITARFLHHEYFEFHSTFKIFMATNHKPRIVGTDNGIWRRIKQVPFKKVISKEERDPGLKEKLLQEREGILAWMVEGFKLWRKEGLGSCKEVDDAVQEYKDDQDVIGEFIGAECVEHDSVSVFSHDLNNRLNAWLKDTAGLNYKIGKNKMAEYMEQRGYRRERASKGDGRGKIKWYGIGLKTDENPVDGYGDRPF